MVPKGTALQERKRKSIPHLSSYRNTEALGKVTLQSIELTLGNSGNYDFREELNVIKAKVSSNKTLEAIEWGDESQSVNNLSTQNPYCLKLKHVL